MRYKIVKEYVVQGNITMDEAISAVDAFEKQYGPSKDSDMNTYRHTPEPEGWDKDEQGDWYKSDEYKALQVYANVQLVDKASTILW